MSIVSYVVSNHCQEGVIVAGCPCIKWQTNFTLKSLFKRTQYCKPYKNRGNNTENIALVASIVSAPSFITRRRTPFLVGRENLDGSWPYSIIAMYSGFSTSSNGWSQAIIHSRTKRSNVSWSQGSYLAFSCGLLVKFMTYCRFGLLFRKGFFDTCYLSLKLFNVVGMDWGVKWFLPRGIQLLIRSRGCAAALHNKIQLGHVRERSL